MVVMLPKPKPCAVFSEYGLLRARVEVELRWLHLLGNNAEIQEVPKLSSEAESFINDMIANFSVADAQEIKDIERTTNHDVKAVEYFIKKNSKPIQNCMRSVSSYTLPVPRKTSTTPLTALC